MSGLTSGGLTDALGVGGIAVGLGRTLGSHGGFEGKSVDVDGMVKQIVQHIESGLWRTHVGSEGHSVGDLVVGGSADIDEKQKHM